MALAVRSITTERGLDPREYTLVAYGGGGPLHAVAIARELGLPRVLVPPSPSTFSAWGMLAIDLRHDLVRTVLAPLAATDRAWADARFLEMQREIETILPPVGAASTHRAVDLRYLGQEHTVTIALEDLAAWPALRRRFDEAHQRAYGYAASDVDVQLLNLRLAVVFPLERPPLPALGPARRWWWAAVRDAKDPFDRGAGYARVSSIPANGPARRRPDRGPRRRGRGRDHDDHRAARRPHGRAARVPGDRGRPGEDRVSPGRRPPGRPEARPPAPADEPRGACARRRHAARES